VWCRDQGAGSFVNWRVKGWGLTVNGLGCRAGLMVKGSWFGVQSLGLHLTALEVGDADAVLTVLFTNLGFGVSDSVCRFYGLWFMDEGLVCEV
jgi:hypothetical protein